MFASVTEEYPIALVIRSGIGRDSRLAQELGKGCASPKELQASSAGVSQPHHSRRHCTGAQGLLRGATQMSACH